MKCRRLLSWRLRRRRLRRRRRRRRRRRKRWWWRRRRRRRRLRRRRLRRSRRAVVTVVKGVLEDGEACRIEKRCDVGFESFDGCGSKQPQPNYSFKN
jgi:hypothetical protein